MLEQERKEIDAIDEELVRLFARRMAVVERVAKVKQQAGLPVFQPEREQQVIARRMAQAPEALRGYTAGLFTSLMDLSRDYQRAQLKRETPLEQTLRAAMQEEKTLPASPVVACLGVEGAFSQLAALEMFPGAQCRFCPSFSEVARAVQTGEAQFGVLPVENSAAGSITENYDLLTQHRFYIAKATAVEIEQCLLGVPGARLEEIKTVLSHKQGLMQTAEFIRSIGAAPVERSNTAVAAQEVAARGDRTQAAVASRQAAKLYGLTVLRHGIQSSEINRTRFVAISPSLYIPHNAGKISVVFSLPHVTGSLYRTLARFSYEGLNLTKIESRPIPGKNFEYFFFLDFEGNLRKEETLRMLCGFAEETERFAFLGNYEETLARDVTAP